MSTLKADAVTTKSDITDLTLTGGGTGVPNLEAGFKIGGTAGVPVSELRAGTDGELITWNASGVASTVPVGTATHILTSNGAGSAPTFQAAAAGGKILQVTSGGTTTQTDTTSSSYADVVGMNVAITPSATSSSVLVLVSINVTATGNQAVGEFQLYRTTGGSVTNLNVWSQVNHLEHENAQHFLMQYDTGISTTSATNYYLRFFRTDQSGTLTVNRNDGSDIARSDMTLIEVGA